jgi:hypothetical protein
MQNLRGVKLSTKLIAFLFLVLGTASSLALVHPQPVNAEGYLFGKLLCTVRVLINRDCEPAAPKAETPPSTSGSTGGANGPSPQKPSTTTNTPQTAPANTGGAQLEPVKIPEELLVEYTELELPRAHIATPTTKPDASQQAAYFNTYSPYAVEGAQAVAATNEAPVQRTTEGWRLFGVTWYWWVIVGLAIGLLAASGRNMLKTRLSKKHK